METDEAVEKETTKSEEKRESERDRMSSSGKNGKDSEAGTPKIKEEKMETTEIKQEDEESKSADSAIINGSQDENTNDGDMEDVSSVFVWWDWPSSVTPTPALPTPICLEEQKVFQHNNDAVDS